MVIKTVSSLVGGNRALFSLTLSKFNLITIGFYKTHGRIHGRNCPAPKKISTEHNIVPGSLVPIEQAAKVTVGLDESTINAGILLTALLVLLALLLALLPLLLLLLLPVLLVLLLLLPMLLLVVLVFFPFLGPAMVVMVGVSVVRTLPMVVVVVADGGSKGTNASTTGRQK